MSFGLDHLPCACLQISQARKITFANAYCARQVERDAAALIGMDIADLFSPASRIFCDSYVYPYALAETVCQEVQLTVLTPTGGRRPVIANVSALPDGGFAWVLLEADNRNLLFLELDAARTTLERQTEALQRLSCTDPLTGLLNRRGFDAELALTFGEARWRSQPISVLMLDVDRFKAINDSQGHALGDEILAAIGEVLAAVCRSEDSAGRLGGDEFACVLPGMSAAAAAAVCARIHAAVAQAVAALSPATVSIGLCERVPYRTMTGSEALAAADQALYAAKAAGRNTTAQSRPSPNLRIA